MILKPIKTTVIDVHPATHVRSTKNESWLFRVSDEYLEELDRRKEETHGKRGGLLRRKRQLEVHNAHKAELRAAVERLGFKMPLGYFAIWFYVPMPKSWRKKKIQENIYNVHQNTPDLDNFSKKFFDSVMPRRNRIKGDVGADDRKIFNYAAFKVWVPFEEACIKVVEYDPEDFNAAFAAGHPATRTPI